LFPMAYVFLIFLSDEVEYIKTQHKKSRDHEEQYGQHKKKKYIVGLTSLLTLEAI
jgi:hypothetical protein